jgi:hypothetical protein
MLKRVSGSCTLQSRTRAVLSILPRAANKNLAHHQPECCKGAPGASQSNLKFNADLIEAVASADLVQENGPERCDAISFWKARARCIENRAENSLRTAVQ